LNAPGKIGFDDDGQPVGVTEFDFDAVEADKDAIILEQDARIADLEADVRNYKEKACELVRVIFGTILSGLPAEAEAGRRSYFFAQLVFEKPPFDSQAQLAKHLGISGAAVSQQLNDFREDFPLISQISRPHT